MRDANLGKWQRRNMRSKRLVLELMHAQGGFCGICGKLFQNVWPQHIVADHIVPRSKGGSNHIDNLQAAHRSCDSAKGNDSTHEVETVGPEMPAPELSELPEITVRGLARARLPDPRGDICNGED